MDRKEYDSFMDAADRLIDGISDWKKLCEDFSKQLNEELIALSVDCFPELETCRDQWVELLYPEIEYCSENILDSYERIANSGGDEDKLTNIFTVPKPITKEDGDQFLHSELDKYPEKFHSQMIKRHEGTFAEDQFYDVFLHRIHKKMKEVLYSFFSEIIDFTGDQLRAIDGDIFLMGARLYYEGFRYVAGEYIVDRFDY